jgi:hypothetical protein
MVVLDGWLGEKILSNFVEPKTELEEHENATLQYKQKIHELLLKLQSNYEDLKGTVEEDNAMKKDVHVSKLENKFHLLRSKADAMMDKLRFITRTQNKMDDIIAINDDQYLRDKIDNVKTLSDTAREMSQMLAHNPSMSDLREGGLEQLKNNINMMIQCVNQITQDDQHLTKIYSRLSDL